MNDINLTKVQGKEILIETSKLLSDEVLYINATYLALQFGKSRQSMNDYFRTKGFLEYEQELFKVLEKQYFKNDELVLRYSIKGNILNIKSKKHIMIK